MFLIVYPVDSGSFEKSFIIVPRLVLAEEHACRFGGTSSLLPKSGAEFVFERAPAYVKDRYRFEFETIPFFSEDVTPDTMIDMGYSDSTACALAISHKQQNITTENASIIAISCSFAYQDQNKGMRGFQLERVTNSRRDELAQNSLHNKWHAAKNNGAKALVLHEEDAKILTQKVGVDYVTLEKNTFSTLQNSPIEELHIISCKPNQLVLLAEALEIDSELYKSREAVPFTNNQENRLKLTVEYFDSTQSTWFPLHHDKKSLQTNLQNKSFITIGRNRTNDLCVRIPNNKEQSLCISGYHCKIMLQANNQYALIDLGSSNGTFLNGKQLDANSLHNLQEEDCIELAKNEIRIWITEQKAQKTLDTISDVDTRLQNNG